MRTDPLAYLDTELQSLKEQGLYRPLRVLDGEQAATSVFDGASVVNLSSNNYLGLTTPPRLKARAIEAVERFGVGSGAVRSICGTMAMHVELERRLAEFKQTEAVVVFQSGFTSNAGTVAAILSKEDAIVSDALNHASIIDGVRLCKAKRYRYANNDMADLERNLTQARADGAKRILIATDGVFSMDGILADLKTVCDLADQYGAMTMVDDSHAVGFVGPSGRGTHEHCGVLGRVDILTGTLGKALGGASGGYTSGRKEIVAWLRQRSRPYLFSNTLAPVIAAASIACLDLLESSDDLRTRLRANSARFREGMQAAGFTLAGAGHPIIPVMLGDAKVASQMAERMMAEGIYVIGFSFPVVPRGQARIRTQMSAAHTPEHVDRAIAAFTKIGREMGLVS